LFSQNGYNGAVADISGDRTNPLRGLKAFVASSHGWTASRLDLSSLAGHHVRLRWRIGGDTVVGSLGWYVDNVRTYTCNTTTTTLAADPNPVPSGTPTMLTATVDYRGSGSPVPDGTVVIFYARTPGTTSWGAPIGQATTAGGAASVPESPIATTEYQARVVRDGNANPSISPTVTVTVS
jgi:bacillolysin